MAKSSRIPTVLKEFREGRDSNQLAEFPISTLSDKVPSGMKTLEFEDEIKDWASGKWLHRKVCITGSDKWGLPTAKDDEVITALIQLSKLANDFTNPEVRFTKRQVIDLLGWPNSGWAFDRVEESLHRWVGTSIHYFNAWRDHENKTWQNSVAHGVIDYTEIEKYSRDRRSFAVRSNTSSCIIWNRRIFESLRSGYVKKLDFSVYRSLKRPAAKRAYRFLDKRFFHSPNWEFDLRTFACEKLGLSRSYDTGQLKERLKPALEELHHIGFIEPVTYCKQRPKHWTIAVAKKVAVPQPTRVNLKSSSLIHELLSREISQSVAFELVEEYSEQLIREKVAFFDQLVANRDRRIDRNPPGWLISAIKRDFKPSQGDQKLATKMVSKRIVPVKTPVVAVISTEDKELNAHVSQLSPEGVVELTQLALSSATRLQRDTFERLAKNDSPLLPEFRKQMMISYIKSTRRASSKSDSKSRFDGEVN